MHSASDDTVTVLVVVVIVGNGHIDEVTAVTSKRGMAADWKAC